MSEYLSKEEIKQWRSSLEKITLEEYAARLGKKIEEAKHTNDLVDIVLKGQPVMSSFDSSLQTRSERITSIAERAYEREKQISHTPFSIKAPKSSDLQEESKKETPKTSSKNDTIVAKSNDDSLREEVKVVFRKALTDREQMVFEYFLNNQNTVVYAKDLAKLLDLPRDYVYKYIKNLRAKIEGEKLVNAEAGGFILNV